MSSSAIKLTPSMPDPALSHVTTSGGSQEPLSRTSTYAKTIPLPNKIIHVVRSPTEGYKLRDVEWVIQGSQKHLEYLRESASILDSKRSELKRIYSDVVDEVEMLKSDLDAVSNDLDRLSRGQNVELHATFDKFGKIANLQVHDAPTDNGDGKKPDKNTGLKLFKPPTVRQYFHRGVLYRSIEMEETRPMELFIDLFYVGIIAINAQTVARTPDSFQLHIFALTFMWFIVRSFLKVVHHGGYDDVLQRMSILFILTCLLGFTINMTDALSSTLTMIISFYVAARLFLVGMHVFFATLLPYMRPILLANAAVEFSAAAVWIGSIFVPLPQRYAMLWTAITIDWCGYLGMVLMIRASPRMHKTIGERLTSLFAYYPAINIEHHVDRMNSFITLVFGHIILSVLYQSSAGFGLNAFFGKAVLSMCIAYGLNWLYFDVDNTNLASHAIRRHFLSSIIYGLAHLPFIMGLTLVGAALEYLVIAYDSPDASPDDLMEEYQAKSEYVINSGLRWFFCGGLAMALFCMGVISLSHVHVDSNQLNLKKRYRLGLRGLICLVILFLPLAPTLNSLQLIGLVTALLWFVIAVETWGNATKCHVWIGEKNKREYMCKFGERCVQGEERIPDQLGPEKRDSDDGDLIFGV